MIPPIIATGLFAAMTFTIIGLSALVGALYAAPASSRWWHVMFAAFLVAIVALFGSITLYFITGQQQ